MDSKGGLDGRRAVVAGCGPVGAFVAICLARQGWRVEVYEAMPVLSKRMLTRANRLRSYDIILQQRGIEVLSGEGVELGPKHANKVETIMLHGRKPGKCRKVPVPGVFMILSRDNLIEALQEHGLRTYPELISYQYEHKLVGIDFEGKQATFEKDGGGCVNRPYDLFVGADGVWSKTRKIMAEKGFVTFKQEFQRNYIKQLAFEKLSDLPGANEAWVDSWHLWLSDGKNHVMSGASNPGGGFRFSILYRSADILSGPHYLRNVKTEAGIKELFKTKFSDIFLDQPVPEIIPKDLWEQVPNNGGVTTDCSAFHAGDGVVLVGDSAHSVFPNAGQGCNLGLESCVVLAELIAKHGGDLSKALPTFTAEWKPEADAAAAISKPWILSKGTFVRQTLLRSLHRVLPFVFGEEVGNRMKEGRLPYTKIQAIRQWQTFQLKFLLALGVTTIGMLLARR